MYSMPQLKQMIKCRTSLVRFGIIICVLVPGLRTLARDITFCGEQIPISNSFVATRLMEVIRQQIRYANLPQLRSEAKKYFPIIEYYLKAAGMPADLKYIPIIES